MIKYLKKFFSSEYDVVILPSANTKTPTPPVKPTPKPLLVGPYTAWDGRKVELLGYIYLEEKPEELPYYLCLDRARYRHFIVSHDYFHSNVDGSDKPRYTYDEHHFFL